MMMMMMMMYVIIGAYSRCLHSVSFCFQIDAAATLMGTVANIGLLVINAQIPCGSVISLFGETNGPLAFTCGPMPTPQQLPGITYTSGIKALCCPTYTVHAEKAGYSASETISTSSLTTASFAQLQTGVPGTASLSNSNTTTSGQCNSSVTYQMLTQAQVRQYVTPVLCPILLI
jgi:hypothetical protein